jgi:hypothetical protein
MFYLQGQNVISQQFQSEAISEESARTRRKSIQDSFFERNSEDKSTGMLTVLPAIFIFGRSNASYNFRNTIVFLQVQTDNKKPLIITEKSCSTVMRRSAFLFSSFLQKGVKTGSVKYGIGVTWTL